MIRYSLRQTEPKLAEEKELVGNFKALFTILSIKFQYSTNRHFNNEFHTKYSFKSFIKIK